MTLPPGARHGAGEHRINWDAPETEAGVDINVESLEGSGDIGARLHCRFALPLIHFMPDSLVVIVLGSNPGNSA